MSDYNEFRKTLAWLFALYPSAQMTAAISEAWWALLAEYPAELIRHSALRLVRHRTEHRFPPSAPELLDYVRSDARSWGQQRPPDRPALPEPSLTTAIGPDHPATLALESARGEDGEIDPRRAARALAGLVGGVS